jgi:hypothetical protein
MNEELIKLKIISKNRTESMDIVSKTNWVKSQRKKPGLIKNCSASVDFHNEIFVDSESQLLNFYISEMVLTTISVLIKCEILLSQIC